MPIFEYECKKCGAVFEVLEKNSDSHRTTHEGCGGKLELLLSPPALQFKGSGWYITDYARKSSSKSSSDGSAPAKSEAKPESRTEPAKSETAAKPAPAK